MSALQYPFDKELDVPFVSQGAPHADADSEEVGEGVVARFDPGTCEIVAFIILNLLKEAEKGLRAVVLPFRAESTLIS